MSYTTVNWTPNHHFTNLALLSAIKHCHIKQNVAEFLTRAKEVE